MSLYTFRIKGSSKLTIKIKNNPVCEHLGGVSVWKVFCSPKVANALVTAVESEGLSIEELDLGLNAEQIQFKKRLMGNVKEPLCDEIHPVEEFEDV